MSLNQSRKRTQKMENEKIFQIIEPIILNSIERKIEDGTIQSIFEEQIVKAVEDALNNAVGWNSEFKKKMEEKIKSIMSSVADQYDSFPVYVEKLTKCVNDAMSTTAIGSYEELGRSLASIAGAKKQFPESMTMNELLNAIVAEFDGLVINIPDRSDIDDFETDCASFTLSASIDEYDDYRDSGFAVVTLTVYCDSDDENKDIEGEEEYQFRIIDGRVFLKHGMEMGDVKNYKDVSKYLLAIHNAGTIITELKSQTIEFELPLEG